MSGIIAKKLQMTQIAKDDKIVPVTLLHVPKLVISQIKTQDKDGYESVVIDVMSDDGSKVAFKKEIDLNQAGLDALASLAPAPAAEAVQEEVAEAPAEETEASDQTEGEEVAKEETPKQESAPAAPTTLGIGDELPLTILTDISEVRLTSVSKGRGFTGAMKRWNFKGGPAAHGSKFHRALGSIGTRKPRRTKPGKKMHGRHGTDTITLKSVPLELVDQERRIIALRGPVPGARNTYVHIQFS